ncbi:unnamed protein product [Microthlaspi erraticum]|uniref:Uncharacterized protein n=1 Tax=Microthlaspi erraticum TaxID=1685480 RepID=A0A6D2K7A4_9BRAS|nr:unnamed protein product [Microthlaspi erraticum]
MPLVIQRKTPKEDAYLCEIWSKGGCLPRRKMEHKENAYLGEKWSTKRMLTSEKNGAGTVTMLTEEDVDKKIHAWKWLVGKRNLGFQCLDAHARGCVKHNEEDITLKETESTSSRKQLRVRPKLN